LPAGRGGRAIFTLEDGSEYDLKDILSVTRNHTSSVKDTFHGKPINILVNTGCDIVCVSSHITPHNEWKKVHDLKVHGFNGGIINCPAKADIEWKMGNISSTWKNVWVLPAMAYDIIIGTDWIERWDPLISFSKRTISMGGHSCDMKNVCKDLIQKCSVISTHKVESLFTEDKIIEITAWNISKVDRREPAEEERDTQIDTLLKEFTDVFSKELHPSPDHSTHNFYIYIMAGAKPHIWKHGCLSECETEEIKKWIKELLAARHIKPSNSP
jgi:Retroviral aspartyl protease